MRPPPQDRNIDHLVPELAVLCRRHIGACWQQHGINLLVIETLRTVERQDWLYASGRLLANLPDEVRMNIRPWLNEWLATGLTRAPGRIVTNAHGLEGQHCHGRAYDCVAVISGQAIWDNPDLWEKIMTTGESLELTAGGRWKIKDFPHFQLSE